MEKDRITPIKPEEPLARVYHFPDVRKKVEAKSNIETGLALVGLALIPIAIGVRIGYKLVKNTWNEALDLIQNRIGN